MGFKDRIAHAWNAFVGDEKSLRRDPWSTQGVGYSSRPDRTRLSYSNERSMLSSMYTRLSIDVAANRFNHARTDDDDNFLEVIKSDLNSCLTVEANLDQGASDFRQDIATTLFDKGVIAVVPVDTSLNPNITGGYDIRTMRVGEITQWFPKDVVVRLYNEAEGKFREIRVPKSMTAIITNPLYSIMNEPNSTLQRLIRKLNLLDSVDEQISSGKLDIIIQLPYVVKTEQKKKEATERRLLIEQQLTNSKYGVAYIDGTEKITQLNRPAENNLLKQVEYLTDLLYSQLGLTKEVMDGTATEEVMVQYYIRTIEPILRVIAEEFRRKFLTKTARSQGQTILYHRDIFKYMTAAEFAELSDKLTRNEVVSSNELRGFIGMKPSADPRANSLVNPNMPGAEQPALTDLGEIPTEENTSVEDNLAQLNDLEQQIDKMLSGSG